MSDRIPCLELTILRPQPPKQTFSVTLEHNGYTAAHHHPSIQSYQAVHALVDGVRQLFKENRTPQSGQVVAPHFGGDTNGRHLLLHSVGVELFYLWLEPLWLAIQPLFSLHKQIALTLLSNAPEVFNMPWELLQWPDGVVLGLDERVIFCRRPLPCTPPLNTRFTPQVSPPMALLFAASAPVGLETSHAEDAKSAEPFAPFSSPLLPDLPFSYSTLQNATHAMVQQHVQTIRPFMVCLTAPVLISGEQGFLGFEEKNGQADIRSAKEIATEIFADSPVALVMVVGRTHNHTPPVAAVAAVCQGLVAHGVAHALAWPSAGADPFFSAFLNAFLHNLRGTVSVDQSVHRARHTLYSACEQAGCPAWIQPVLYARDSHTSF